MSWSRLVRWLGYWGRGRAITLKSSLGPDDIRRRLGAVISYPSAGLFETYLQDPTDEKPLRGVLGSRTLRVHVPLRLIFGSNVEFAGSIDLSPDGFTVLTGRMRYPTFWRISYPMILVLWTLWAWIGIGIALWILLLFLAVAHTIYIPPAVTADDRILGILARTVDAVG